MSSSRLSSTSFQVHRDIFSLFSKRNIDIYSLLFPQIQFHLLTTNIILRQPIFSYIKKQFLMLRQFLSTLNEILTFPANKIWPFQVYLSHKYNFICWQQKNNFKLFEAFFNCNATFKVHVMKFLHIPQTKLGNFPRIQFLLLQTNIILRQPIICSIKNAAPLLRYT